MYIIKIESTKNGSRPPLQPWNKSISPDGYALCPDNFCPIFYSTNPAGFVNITIKDDIVIEMSVNQDAIDSYNATKPQDNDVTNTTIKPTAQDDIDAMLIDHEYRLTLLELGIS